VRPERQRFGDRVGRIGLVAVGDQPLGDQGAVRPVVAVEAEFAAVERFEAGPGHQAAAEIDSPGRLQSAVATDAVAVQHRLDVAEEAQRADTPGGGVGIDGSRAVAISPAFGGGATDFDSWQPTQPRVSPGWKLMNDRIRRSSMKFSSRS